MLKKRIMEQSQNIFKKLKRIFQMNIKPLEICKQGKKKNNLKKDM
jgi:hypothetical protein